jgi:hypothetical protein
MIQVAKTRRSLALMRLIDTFSFRMAATGAAFLFVAAVIVGLV